MRVKILENGKAPTKAYDDDAGFDVYCPIDVIIPNGQRLQIKLGICIEIEKDEVAIMSERSGMAIKHGITSIGNIIDSGYRGEISIILFNSNIFSYDIKKGDKIGQIIIQKLGNQELNIVDKLYNSDRGEKAHYSSGK